MSDNAVISKHRRVLRFVALMVTGLGLLGILATLGILWFGSDTTASVEDGASTQADLEDLLKKTESARLKEMFILIDTARNRLYLRKGETVLLEAVCSTGSGVELVAGDKHWTFRTPRGAFRIRNKATNPVWRKPDWAFLEEGEPVPKHERDRYESGVLGDYALGIGDGYFIHGTLYTRLLGTNVTHGCIRLGSEDLEFLAKKAPIGTKVYIF